MRQTSMLNLFLIALYALMPVALMTTYTLPSAIFYVAILVCVIVACRQRAALRTMLADYKVLLLCTSVLTLVVLVSFIAHQHWAGSDFESSVRWSLGLPLLLLALGQIKPQALRQSMWGVYVAAIAATIYVFRLTYPTFERPITQIYNAVGYGNLMLLLSVISVFSLCWHLTKWAGIERAIKLLVAVLTFAGFIMTQTRSGWVAMPVFVLLGVALFAGFKRPWRAIAYAAGILIVAVAIGFSSTSLRERVQQGYNETLSCYDTTSISDTSVCIRFQLWRAAGHAFAHNPVIGLGDSGLFQNWVKTRALPDHVVSKYVADNYGEPHNDMMKILYSFGILGGLGLLLLYLAPAWVFIRRLSHRYPPEIRAAAAMGAAVCLGFAIFGLTELMFRGMRTVSFYTMFIALFLVLSDPRTFCLNHGGQRG